MHVHTYTLAQALCAVCGWPSLTASSDAALPSGDMVLAGPNDPPRRHPARVPTSSTSKVAPISKGKSSPGKVKKRSPTKGAAQTSETMPAIHRTLVDRQGNVHDPTNGRFVGKSRRSAAEHHTESGRSSPETHASFRSTTSIFHLASADTDEEDATSPGSEMISKLQEAERSLSTNRSELEDANASSELYRSELDEATANSAESRSELREATKKLKELSAELRTSK